MKPGPQPISAERARSIFDYDPASGVIVRKVSTRAYADKPAGFIHHTGYRVIKVGLQQVLAHRLAWLLFHGSWPKEYIDHINCDRADNRIDNLREASHAQNGANSKVRTASGYKGVYPVPRMENKWQAQVNVNGKTTNIGFYDSIEDAARAYREAATSLYGEFARFQ